MEQKVELERQETRRLRKEIESNKVDMRLAMKELDHIPCIVIYLSTYNDIGCESLLCIQYIPSIFHSFILLWDTFLEFHSCQLLGIYVWN